MAGDLEVTSMANDDKRTAGKGKTRPQGQGEASDYSGSKAAAPYHRRQ